MPNLPRAALAVALLVAPLAPARAQPAARCQAVLDSLPLLQEHPVVAEPLGPDGCRFAELWFGLGHVFGYRVPFLVEHGVPPELFGAGKMPSFDLEAQARGIVPFVHSGKAKTDWLYQQQVVPFDVTLVAANDPAKRESTLRRLAMDGASVGHVALTATAVDTDETYLFGSPGLRALTLHLDSHRFISIFLLSPLLLFLPDDDPGGAVERGKAQAVAKARALLSQSGASAATTEAITGFIADFPHPRHVLDLSVTAATPVSIATLQQASGSLVGALALARTLTVTATYAGDAQ